MRHFAPILAVALAFGGTASAQTAAPAPTPATPPTAAPAPAAEGAPRQAGMSGIREIRDSCRDELRGQGLKGDAMHKAVSDCVVKKRPDLAGEEQCRADGFSKGLRKSGLRTFVRDCIRSKG
jgi:hypothetical protein